MGPLLIALLVAVVVLLAVATWGIYVIGGVVNHIRHLLMAIQRETTLR